MSGDRSTVEVGLYQGDPAEWDALALESPGGTHYHRLGWRHVMEVGLGHRSHYLGAWDEEGGTVGLLPLVYVGSPIFGRFLVSMPFLNYGGPIGSEAAICGLAQGARAVGERHRVKLVELRSAIPLGLDWRVSHRKTTVVLDLPDDPDTLFGSFRSKLRSQVRRPQKEGVAVQFGLDQLEPFYAVLSRHMRDLGTPVLPKRFFAEIVAQFSESARLAVAYLADQPIAVGLGFVWGGELELTWASALVEHKRIAANMLVYWEFMRRSIEEGLGRFNFGRCTPGSGTHRFKLQWGGYDQPLHWYQLSQRPGEKTPSPNDAAYSWGPRVWKSLPLAVTNRLGPQIARWIP